MAKWEWAAAAGTGVLAIREQRIGLQQYGRLRLRVGGWRLKMEPGGQPCKQRRS